MHRQRIVLKSLGFNVDPIIKKEKVNLEAPIEVEKQPEEDQNNPRTVFNNIIELTFQKLEKGETKKMRKKDVIDQLKEYFELNLPISRDDPNLFNF